MLGLITNDILVKVLAAALFVTVAFSAIQTVRVNRAKVTIEKLEIEIQAAKDALELEKASREEERTTERQVSVRTTNFCRNERELAIIAGRAIQGIIDGKNSDGSSRGSLVTADELRDIVSEKRRTAETR